MNQKVSKFLWIIGLALAVLLTSTSSTFAQVSVIDEETFKSLFPDFPIIALSQRLFSTDPDDPGFEILMGPLSEMR